MNILITGANGMVGTALTANLKNIRDGKNKTRPALHIEEIYRVRSRIPPRRSWMSTAVRRTLCSTWRESTARRTRRIS